MKTLERLTDICLSMPETTREIRGDHASFHVRKKIFAYFLNSHHGDGIVSVCVKALPGDNARLIAHEPERFYMPAYIGPRGWVGYRLDEPKPDWSEVRDLVLGSYRAVAPKTLAKTARTGL